MDLTVLPLDIPDGMHHAWAGGPSPFAHALGGLMGLLLFLLLAAALFHLFRIGALGRMGPPWMRAGHPGPPWARGGQGSPEFEAKKVLAERFARGDISTDEFMERASVLNWTPGAEPLQPQPGKRRKRR